MKIQYTISICEKFFLLAETPRGDLLDLLRIPYDQINAKWRMK